MIQTYTKKILPAVSRIFGVAAGRVASAAMNLILSLALMRLLTKEEYGLYFVYYTATTFAAMIPGLAINSAFVFRYQNTTNQVGLLTTFLISKMVLVVISEAAVVALYSTELISKMSMIAVSAGLNLSFFDSAMCISQAQRHFRIFGVLMPLRNLVIILAVGFAYFCCNGLDLRIVIIALFAGSLALAIISFLVPYGVRLGDFRILNLLELLAVSRRFAIFEGSAVILQRIEVWGLSYFAAHDLLSTADVAEYGAGFTFSFLFPLISSSVTSILITTVRSGVRVGRKGLLKLLSAAFFAFILTLIFSAFSYQATKLFVPEKYHELHWIIPTICLGMLFSFCTNYARIQLLAVEGDFFLNIVYLVQVFVGAIASFSLICIYGLKGAVCSFLIVRAFALVLIVWKFIKENL